MWRLVPLALAYLASSVNAHGGVLSYSINGKTYTGYSPYNSPTGQSTIQRPWATYDPITSATASTLACNDDGSSGGSQLTATGVPAGSKITAYWNQVWPHNTGPMLTYLAQCPGSSCNGVSATSVKWFKIDQAGLISGTLGTGTWAAGQMIANNNSWTSTIPSTVPSGNYLIRFETIALHSLPAQFYPECAQIEITGGGTRAPLASELVSFPGGYGANDPGINVNLYSSTANTTTTYVIPGPPLYGSGGSGGGNPVPTSAPPTGTTVPPPPPPPPPPAPTVGTVPQYAQCGGVGWSGGTVCISPYKCTKQNDYYSQCI